MKKCLYLFVLLPIVFISCASDKKNDVIIEDLNDNSTEISTAVEADLENEEISAHINTQAVDEDVYDDEEVKITSNLNKKGLSSFFGTSSNFCEYDSIGLYVSNGFGKPKSAPAVMVYVPANDTFGFGSNYLAAFYYVHFDDEGRKAFDKAVKQYLNDFENKRLKRDDKKSYKAYGKTEVNLNWGSFKASCPNYGKGNVVFGYRFVDKSPYFVMSTETTVFNERFNNDNTAPTESLNLTYYFTKAYAGNLTKNLSEEVVNSIRREYKALTYGDTYIPDDADQY